MTRVRLRLGTRSSRLALAQSLWVAARLEARAPGTRVELVEIRTTGDRITDVPLGPELGQAFFTKEIEDALLEGRIDLAVHSCKDLSSHMVDGLILGAVPPREDPRDVLVSRGPTLADLEAGARVGTSSPRRKGFLALARPDLIIADQRGNVPTRLRAVDTGLVDAVVLAAAGLRRLGLKARITEMLMPSVMLPAAGQGALALQIRDGDPSMAALMSLLDHHESRAQVTAERACMRALEAGCQSPVGALAETDHARLVLRASVVTPFGVVRADGSGEPDRAEQVGQAVAAKLLRQLGLSTLKEAAWAGGPPASQALRVPKGT